MVNALGIAGNLGADHAGGVAVFLGAANTPYLAGIEDFDIERAGRRTIMRTGGMARAEKDSLFIPYA